MKGRCTTSFIGRVRNGLPPISRGSYRRRRTHVEAARAPPGQYLLCFVAVPAGVLAEADADVRLKDALPSPRSIRRLRICCVAHGPRPSTAHIGYRAVSAASDYDAA
jgi:hypothetical protein